MAHTDSASALHTPQLPPVTQTYNGPVESRDAGRCDSIAHIDESQLVRVPIVIAGDSQLSREIPASAPAVPVSDSGGVKRKRGRPPKGAQAKTPPVKKMKMKENDNDKDEEEDVCFICFDGGSLVLCDRRGCPKAYHVTCIKRDEAFFQSKAKWNCGWHICSICEKTSYYMCYTCTFSLCKGCTKDSDYVSVRGEKGFCSMCFKTIMLIENKDPGNKDAPQVDFDDKTSWEYLFKIYWVVLKQKLSLTLPELMQAKSPPLKAVTTSYRAQPARVQNIHNNGKIPIPNLPSTCLETKIPEEIKNKEPIKIQTSDPLTTEKRANDKGTSSIGSTVVPAAKSNVDEYAAVDIHNIKLIYLRRDLVANLFEDNNEKFHAKVVGSIVRIRVPSSHHKEDLYRLVKVVGTNKAAVPYNIGNKSLDVTLAVLNLGKQEDVLIDAISNNHDPSEEECKELRQNIKSGLVERWTVGEIRAKAMSLQAAMFKDWVETEIMRFNQLRDQASEQGQTKELRDCVERLQLLKSPEERRRRMCEAPEIHSDPKMDPYYYGPDDDEADCNSNKKQDKMEVSPKVQRVKEGKDTSQSNNTSERQGDESGTVGMSSTSVNDQATTVGPIPTITSETSTTPLSTESTPPANESEAEKLWHYRDLNGQTQGPFSMLQLQKWSTTGYFPPDMRIWASSQDDSVLLSDALDGQLLYNISVQFKEVGGENINANRRDNTKNKELNSNTLKESKNHSSSNGETDIRNQEMIITSNKQEEVKADSNTSSQTQVLAPNSVEPSMSSEGTHAVVSQAEKSSMSLEWAHAVVPQTGKPSMSLEGAHAVVPQTGKPSMSLEGAHAVVPQTGKPSMSLEGAHAVVPQTGKPQEVELKLKSDLNQENWNSCGPSTSSAEAHVTVTQTKKPQEVVTKLESDLNQLNWNSHGTTTSTTTTTTTTVAESSSVNENQSNPENFPGQSSGQSWRPLPLNFFPNNFESSGRNTGVDIPDLHSPAPKTSSGGWESQSQTVENKHSVSVTSAIPVLEPVTVDLPILTLKMSNEDQNEQEAENIQNKQQSLSMNFPVQDSGPSWAHNTSLEADKWGGYFSNTMKPSIEEWDSGPAMLKPHEALGDNHVSLSSRIDQLFHSPRSNPTSSWQMGFNERIEFSTLAEESVSDLLAEVDAMENQGGLPSPTSVMKSGEELIHGPKHDYFGNMEEEFSPTLDVVNPVKTEAMTLTGDIHLPSHSIRGDPVGSYFDPLKGSSTSAQSSTRAEVYRDTKPTHFPFRSDHDMSDMESRKSRSSKSKSTRGDSLQRAKGEEETKLNLDPNLNPNGLYLQIPPSFNTGHDMVDSSNTHRSRTESMDTDWLKIHQSSEKAKADGRTSNRVPSPLNISRRSGPQEQIDSGWDPLHGNLNQGYQGMSRGSGSIDHVSPGSRVRESRKHGGDRLTSPRDRVSSHGRDSGRDSRGSKSSWSRQSSGGGGNGGYSSSRHTPRGQRVCKFYERGDCRKGALCDYFHP